MKNQFIRIQNEDGDTLKFKLLNHATTARQDGKTERMTLKVPKALRNLTAKELELATWASYGGQCSCHYDCCGCWFLISAQAKRTKRNEMTLTISGGFNY